MTTSQKLWFGFGTLTALWVLICVALVGRLSTAGGQVSQVGEQARQRSALARELEGYLVDYGVAVRMYLHHGDASLRQEAERAASEVEQRISAYGGMAETEHQRSLAVECSSRWSVVEAYGQAMLAQGNREPTPEALAMFRDLRLELEEFLDEEMQSDTVAHYDARRDEVLQEIESTERFAMLLLLLGGIVALVTSGVVARDIVRNERMLAEQGERLRIALETGRLGAWQLEPGTGALECTDTFKANLGLPAEASPTHQSMIEAIHPDDRQQVQEAMLRAILTRTDYDAEYRAIWPDGSVHWIIARGRALYGPKGEAVRVVGVTLDITARKCAEEALAASQEALQEAGRRKDEFLAMLAHELRNPLAPLRNGLQLMKLAKNRPETVEQARSMMERQLKQMVRLIDDLTDVSRITRGKLQLRRERLDLARIVQQAVETSRPLIEERRHTLTISLPAQDLHVDADETRLAQVFSNLLNNAAKYSEEGGQIRLTVEQQGDEAIVSVRDKGDGIPAEMLPRIFELFTQGDSSLERARGGLGIGLSLVRGLVTMHGGTVEAKSEGPGQGSEFCVRLPLAPAPAERPAEEERPRALPSRRILVVDDHRDAAVSLAAMLQMLGNETKTVHDGLQALEAAASFQPDVVLLDIGMPGMNGYDTCRQLRAQPWGQKPLIIALTGWGQEEDKRKSREAGFDHHLVKPVAPEVLEELLAGLKDTA